MKRSYNISQVRPSRRWGAVLALLLCAAGTIWTGCDLGVIDEGIALIVDFSPAKTTVTGQVLDAKTQVPVTASSISVRFSGPDAGRVVDVDGETITELSVPDIGLINFNIGGEEPTEENPAELRMSVSAPGYVTTNEQLIIGETDHTFSLTLTNVNDTPPGVEAMVEQFTSQGGAPVEDVTVTTNFEEETGAQASLRIPKGTVMRTDNGTPLRGEVSASVVYYSNQKDEARDAFPGGFLGVTVSENEEGEENTGSFVTAGFAAIEVTDQEGRQATQFDGPIEIDMDVPPGTFNPETGQPVQPGDMIPVYSFDAETGEWKFEGRTEASLADSSGAKARGTLGVSFTTQHLTFYNLDWWRSPRCTLSEAVLLGGDVTPGWRGYTRWVLRDGRTGYYVKSRNHYRGNLIRFWRAPRNWPMMFQLVDRRSGQVVAEQRINDLCSGGAKRVEVRFPEMPKRVDVDVRASISCPDDTQIRPSNYIAYYFSRAPRQWGYARLSGGSARLSNVFEGASYRFYIRLRDRWEIRNVTIEEGSAGDGITVRRVSSNRLQADMTFEDTSGSVCG